MSHKIRTILEGYELVEITNRTVHSRLLLRPSTEVNRMLIGALGRAQRKFDVKIFGFVWLSNHYHLLASFKDAEQMSQFVADFQRKVAKEVRRLYGWRDKLWARRYSDIPVEPSDHDQIARLRYLFANSCKEGLVASPLDWPGLHCAKQLAAGTWKLQGTWRNCTQESRARHRGQQVRPSEFEEEEFIYLSPLPCWEALSPNQYKKAVLSLIQEVERDARAHHKTNGTRPLGARKILRQDPRKEPQETARSPKPRVHALLASAQKTFTSAYQEFLTAYRAAAELLKISSGNVVFPRGCFPPGLPFVKT